MEVRQLPPEYLPDPFDPVFTLKDGTVMLGRCALNPVSDDLWIWLEEITDFVMAAQIFSNPEKTEYIRSDLSEIESNEYIGYTKLISILTDATGKLSIRLNKGSD